MKINDPETGGICQSLQGRDKGRYYLIVGVDEKGSVLVTDGNFKKLALPKKKKSETSAFLAIEGGKHSFKAFEGRARVRYGNLFRA